jgi:transcriptional regulator GlxA family with amidase domain
VTADWQVLASTRNLITSSCGVQVAPTSGFVEPTTFDYIVVVGGLLNVDEPLDRQALDYLNQAAVARVPLIGLCTGSFILAEAGLMKRHQVCVSWLHVREFQERFPGHRVRCDHIFNLDETRGSCAGGSSAADLAAMLVRRHISRNAERNALEVLQIDKARSARDIQPRRPLFEDFGDQRIKAALLIMEQYLDRALSIDKLASNVNLSRRQLERIFRQKAGISPAHAYDRVRMEHARTLLLQSNATTLEIALDVGFVNASHFTRAFKRVHGRTPSQIRSMDRRVEVS